MKKYSINCLKIKPMLKYLVKEEFCLKTFQIKYLSRCNLLCVLALGAIKKIRVKIGGRWVAHLTQNVTMGCVSNSLNTRQIFSTNLITIRALKHTQRGGGVLKNVTDKHMGGGGWVQNGQKI
jgi:hypothetical protein